MSNELKQIVYRADFVRPSEQRRTKEQRHAIYERNRRKATAPERCWNCHHFTECSLSDSRDCDRWKTEEELCQI